jgi:hypothetical protein
MLQRLIDYEQNEYKFLYETAENILSFFPATKASVAQSAMFTTTKSG